MVSIYNAYKILGDSLHDIGANIQDLTPVENTPTEKEIINLQEAETYISERGKRLNSGVLDAYDLNQYIVHFGHTLSELQTHNLCDMELPDPEVVLNLSEFNEELANHEVKDVIN